MDIRVLQPGDEALLGDAVAASEGVTIGARQAAEHLADPSLVAIVAVVDGAAVALFYGFVLKRFRQTDFFLYSAGVAAAYRRRGIGKAMLARLHALRAERGWTGIFVLTNAGNAGAMALYRSGGGVRPSADDVLFDF